MASGGGEPKGDAVTALAVVAVASEEVEDVVVEEQGITYNDQRSKINDLDLFKLRILQSYHFGSIYESADYL